MLGGLARARRFTIEQFGGEEYAQFAQLMDRQGDVAVFAVQVFVQVEQQLNRLQVIRSAIDQ